MDFKNICLTIVGLLIILFYYFYNPTDIKWLPPCIFHSITGFICPGCGGQRAFHELLHGNITKAFHNNLLIFVVMPMILLKITNELKGKVREIGTGTNICSQSIFLLLLIVVFTILRNIPYYPFTQLVP